MPAEPGTSSDEPTSGATSPSAPLGSDEPIPASPAEPSTSSEKPASVAPIFESASSTAGAAFSSASVPSVTLFIPAKVRPSAPLRPSPAGSMRKLGKNLAWAKKGSFSGRPMSAPVLPRLIRPRGRGPVLFRRPQASPQTQHVPKWMRRPSPRTMPRAFDLRRLMEPCQKPVQAL